MTNKEYDGLVKAYSPNSPKKRNIIGAFLVGGAICSLGQVLVELYGYFGMTEKLCYTVASITLIGLSVLLTGLGVYDKIAKYAGAGTLVPITGFANAVASPAIEFKSEGYILGVGAKMFIIAGPVIVYGNLASVVYGLILYIFG